MDDFTQHKAQLIMALRGQGILSAPVLSALESIPREIFVPETLRMHAYENASLPIALDQTISQPYVVARMTEALELTGRERVLEIGTGSGYQAAILTLLCRRVYTLERLKPLLVTAENKLRGLRISNISFRLGDGSAGWPEAAPFDRIVITCQVAEIPANLLDQLKIGGILIAPTGPSGKEMLVRVKREEDRFDKKELMPVRFVPMLAGTDD